MRIFLVGYMGCGKSMWGKQLACKLNIPFVDLDALIERQQNLSVADIFRTQGEVAFRKMEQSALVSLISHKSVVVATGGGVPCYEDNMDWMNINGITVFMDTTPEVLANRIIGSDQERPLVRGMDKQQLLDHISAHLKSRLPFYEKAHHIVPASDIKISDLVDLFQ